MQNLRKVGNNDGPILSCHVHDNSKWCSRPLSCQRICPIMYIAFRLENTGR